MAGHPNIVYKKNTFIGKVNMKKLLKCLKTFKKHIFTKLFFMLLFTQLSSFNDTKVRFHYISIYSGKNT